MRKIQVVKFEEMEVQGYTNRITLLEKTEEAKAWAEIGFKVSSNEFK